MQELPRGKLTLLFTDIEGSTRLLRALGDRYSDVLSEHRRLLRAAFERHGGVEVDTQGDSFFVVFAEPGEALMAAEESQRALAAHPWPDGTALRVRMGLHSGEPLVAENNYVGIDVHRAARIAAAAHGGQVIVSARTTHLLAKDGAPGATLRDIGAHQLKDLPEPERLFQLVVDGLPDTFPPPRVQEEAIEAARLPDYSLPPADVPCPYKGLLAFEAQDSDLFFGREELTSDLVARSRESNFLAVVGPSGSGKSSLVRAGVVPQLQASADGELRTAIFSPGTSPLRQLSRAREASLVVVDQFEEIFTLCRDDDARRSFIGALLDATEREVCVILVLRADFYGHCAEYPRLASALEGRQALVGPMTAEELRRAIERPGEQAGLVLEPGMVEAILRDVRDQPGALPLLSHSLLETWKRRSGRMLTVIGYLQSGGVHGAIAKTAETVFDEALSREQQAIARNIFLRLTELGEGTEDTRRRASIGELISRPEQEGEVRDVLRVLADARLVTVGENTAEVAHEALIRHWPTLREWLDEDREGRLLHRRLTEAAQEWVALQHDPGLLFRGARLATASEWAAGHDPELNELEREFLIASRQASEAEAERQRRVNRRLRGLLAGAILLLVLAVSAGTVALVQRSNAREAQRTAEAQALKSDAERVGTLALTEPNLDRAMLLAVLGTTLKAAPETRGDLLSVLQKTPALFRLIRPSQNEISALAVSPNGRFLATGDSAGTIRFHDLRSWKQSGGAVRLDGPIPGGAVAFSPNGRTVAVASALATRSKVYFIDVRSRAKRLIGSWPSVPASAGPLRFTHFAFAPGGRRIALAVGTAPSGAPFVEAERLLVFDLVRERVAWRRPYPVLPGQQEVEVAFTPRGRLVTSASQGETVVWNARTAEILRRFPTGGPLDVASTGNLVALGQNNANPANPRSSLAVLDLTTGHLRSLQNLPVGAWITSVEFAPDGATVVGRSFDGGVWVWDVASGTIIQSFTEQTSGLHVALTPDGGTALSGGQDGSVAAWDLSGTMRLARTFRWHAPDAGCPVNPCFALDPSGRYLAETMAQGDVALVDLKAGRTIAMLPAKSGPSTDGVTFSPDGATLATGGPNGNVVLWNVRKRSAARIIRSRGHVWWIAFSPNGKLLAIQTVSGSSSESRVEVRDFRSGAVLYRRTVPDGRGGVTFSADGRQLAALGCCDPNSTVKVWAAESGEELYAPRMDGHASSIAYSPDGRWLAAGTEDGKVVLWDSRTGSTVGSPTQVATGSIETLSFSPDSRLFAASSADQTTTVWDVRTRKRLGNKFPVENGSIPVARFAPGGDLVIENLVDTAIWPMELRSWERFACQVASRDLTPAEWRDLLPTRPYRRICTR